MLETSQADQAAQERAAISRDSPAPDGDRGERCRVGDHEFPPAETTRNARGPAPSHEFPPGESRGGARVGPHPPTPSPAGRGGERTKNELILEEPLEAVAGEGHGPS